MKIRINRIPAQRLSPSFTPASPPISINNIENPFFPPPPFISSSSKVSQLIGARRERERDEKRRHVVHVYSREERPVRSVKLKRVARRNAMWPRLAVNRGIADAFLSLYSAGIRARISISHSPRSTSLIPRIILTGARACLFLRIERQLLLRSNHDSLLPSPL